MIITTGIEYDSMRERELLAEIQSLIELLQLAIHELPETSNLHVAIKDAIIKNVL